MPSRMQKRTEQADALKQEGNALFGQGNWEEAQVSRHICDVSRSFQYCSSQLLAITTIGHRQTCLPALHLR